MPTWLVNPKMDPALMARIETSVTGRHQRITCVRSRARRTFLIRLGLGLAVLGVVGAVVMAEREQRAELRQTRTDLLERWTEQVRSVTPGDQGLLGGIEGHLRAFAGAYTGDLVAEELGATDAFTARLRQPAVYIRGPVKAFSDSKAVKGAASESGRDAFLLCLLSPPPTRVEKAQLEQVRLAMLGGAPVDKLAGNVRPLHDIVTGLPYLEPAWGERVRQAEDMRELGKLERQLTRAPITAAKSGLKSKLLIAVMDEPKEGSGPTELDGEHAHRVRVLVLDLTRNRPLLRLRRLVDPSWIAPSRRARYARELDGCNLALDVHLAVSGTKPER